MATAVENAIAEIAAALLVIPPQHEGLRDFARLNLQPPTLVEVRAALEQYDRRVAKLTAAAAALELLVADGYPLLQLRDISETALQDLRDQAATIGAALGQFHGPNPATALNPTAGAIEPK